MSSDAPSDRKNYMYDKIGLLTCWDHPQEVLVLKKSLASGHWELVCPRCDYWLCLDCRAGRDKLLVWHEFPYTPEGTIPKMLADFEPPEGGYPEPAVYDEGDPDAEEDGDG